MIGFLSRANTPLGWGCRFADESCSREARVNWSILYSKSKSRVYPEFTHDILNNM